eukprot:11161633-Lingulodinium_polyedra.AAC.1
MQRHAREQRPRHPKLMVEELALDCGRAVPPDFTFGPLALGNARCHQHGVRRTGRRRQRARG